MSNGGNGQPSIDRAEHVGLYDTGDNIEAKRVVGYSFNSGSSEWVRNEPVGLVSTANSTATPLNAGQTFTGTGELNNLPDVAVSCVTDQDGTLYMEFSSNGTNWDSSISVTLRPGLHEFHKNIKGSRYFRARVTNTSASNQTYLRLHVSYGSFSPVTSSLNSTVQQNSDAITTRTISEELAIAENLFAGHSIVNKFGTNADIDTTTDPEDIWEGGGLYTGFADNAEVLRVQSSATTDASGNTGATQVRITGLDANYNVLSETVTLNGTTPVTTTNLFLRAHTATVVTVGSAGVNAGTITVRQNTTTTNIMLTIAIGRNQSNCSAYTVPAGYTAYMRAMHVAISGTSIANTPSAAEGNIWTRSFNMPFRSRRPFTVSSSFRLYDQIYGGLVFTEKSDIILRINTTSGDNTSVSGGYDLILVQD